MDRNKLKGAIASSGMTQREVAQKIGISENSMSSKMSGKSYFDTYQVEEICKVLGIVNGEEKATIFLSTPSQFRDTTISATH